MPTHKKTTAAVHRDNALSFTRDTADSVWIVSRNFKLIASNRAYDESMASRFGQAAEKGSDVLAHSLQAIPLYERALGGETFTEIEHVEHPIEVWTETTYSPIRTEKTIMGVTCISRNITDNKKEEARLTLLESVVANATDAILITEVDSPKKSRPKIVYVNDALTKMTGYKKEEIIGKTPRILYGKKSDRKQLAHMHYCFKKSIACEIEIINYKKNGEEFWIHMTMAPVSDRKGQFIHFITIGRDVTERLKNIEAIKEQNIKLTAIARIQSHEVRGPLARIKGLIDLLGQHPTASEEAILIAYLKICANQMDDVIERITNETEEIPSYGLPAPGVDMNLFDTP